MTGIKLACHTDPWGSDGLITAITDIADSGYDGLECPASVVFDYEDRLHVFEEILASAHLQLAGLLQGVDLLDREHADEQVERAANSARFVGATRGGRLTIFHDTPHPEPLTDEEWGTMGAVAEEIGQRCGEFGVDLCFMPKAMHGIGNEKTIKRFLASTNPNLVQLAIDTAEVTLAGSRPQKVVKEFMDRLRLVRYRDASGSKRRSPMTSSKAGSTPQFGRGAVNFETVSKTLLSEGYEGWITVDFCGEDCSALDAATNAHRYLMRKSGLFTL